MIEEFLEYCIFSFFILSVCIWAEYFRMPISFTNLYFVKSFDIDKLYYSIVYKVVIIRKCSFSYNAFFLREYIEIGKNRKVWKCCKVRSLPVN